MPGKIIPARIDVVFKSMFSRKENEDLLKDLVASLLNIPKGSIQNIEVLNAEVYPETADGKFCRLDLKLLADDRLVNIEMQISYQFDFRDRILYYWSKSFSDLEKGSNYYELKPCISINIVNFNMFTCEKYHSCFKMMETERHEILSEKCAIHFFELKKLKKQNKNREIDKDNRMELWLRLIDADSEEELDMLNQTGIPEIKKAVSVIREMSADEKMRELAERREKAARDEATALKYSFKKGEAKNKAETKATVNNDVIPRLKSMGLTDEQIAEAFKSLTNTWSDE